MPQETKTQRNQRRKLTILKDEGKITKAEFKERLAAVYDPALRKKNVPKTCLIRAAFLKPCADYQKKHWYLELNSTIRGWADKVYEAHLLKKDIRVPREYFTPIAEVMDMKTVYPIN